MLGHEKEEKEGRGKRHKRRRKLLWGRGCWCGMFVRGVGCHLFVGSFDSEREVQTQVSVLKFETERVGIRSRLGVCW
jgi:hypothetical protein